MAAETTPITLRNQEDYDELTATIAEIAEAVHRIDHRTAAIEADLHRIRTAYGTGGVRGLRNALGGGRG